MTTVKFLYWRGSPKFINIYLYIYLSIYYLFVYLFMYPFTHSFIYFTDVGASMVLWKTCLLLLMTWCGIYVKITIFMTFLWEMTGQKRMQTRLEYRCFCFVLFYFCFFSHNLASWGALYMASSCSCCWCVGPVGKHLCISKSLQENEAVSIVDNFSSNVFLFANLQLTWKHFFTCNGREKVVGKHCSHQLIHKWRVIWGLLCESNFSFF